MRLDENRRHADVILIGLDRDIEVDEVDEAGLGDLLENVPGVLRVVTAVDQLVAVQSQAHGHADLRHVADEDRLAAPGDGDRLPLLHGGEVDLDGRKRLGGGVGVHLTDERPERQRRANARKGLRRDHDEVATVRLFRRVRRQISLPLHSLAR